MPRPKHSQEVEVAHSLKRSSLCSADSIGIQGCGIESRSARVCDRIRGVEITEPIADPISVSSPNNDLDAGFDDVGELGEERAGV